MATTVSYKNNTLTTIGFDDSATLNTQGTWLEDDITINVDALNLATLTVTPNTSTQTFNQFMTDSIIPTGSYPSYAQDGSAGVYIIGTLPLELGATYQVTGVIKINNISYTFSDDNWVFSLSNNVNGRYSGDLIQTNPSSNIYIEKHPNSDQYYLVSYGTGRTYTAQITTAIEFKKQIDGYLPVTINPIPSNYIIPTGTLQILGNGTYDVSSYASAEVSTASVVSNQNKTVTPTESQQTISADSGYTGLGTVTINAISNTYVGSGITTRTQNDLTFEYDYGEWFVDVPSGYYANSYYKTIPSGSATTPTTTITTTPTISVNASGLITVTANATQSITPTISAGYVTNGTAGTVTVNGSNTSQLSTQAATTITPTTSSQTAVAAGKYTTGTITVAAIPANYIDSSLLQIYYTGSSEPSGNLGNNGDLYFQTVE